MVIGFGDIQVRSVHRAEVSPRLVANRQRNILHHHVALTVIEEGLAARIENGLPCEDARAIVRNRIVVGRDGGQTTFPRLPNMLLHPSGHGHDSPPVVASSATLS